MPTKAVTACCASIVRWSFGASESMPYFLTNGESKPVMVETAPALTPMFPMTGEMLAAVIAL